MRPVHHTAACSSGKALDQCNISTLSRRPLIQNGSDLYSSLTSLLLSASTTQNAPIGFEPMSSRNEPATSTDCRRSSSQEMCAASCCSRIISLWGLSVNRTTKSISLIFNVQAARPHNASHNRTPKAERSVAFWGPSLWNC